MLEIIGLLLNFFGTIILAKPLLKYKIYENYDGDNIPDDGFGKDKKGRWFTRTELLKNRNIALVGLGLIAIGFLFQLFPVVANFLIEKDEVKDFSLQNSVKIDAGANECEKLLIDVENEYQDNANINTEKSNSDYDNFVIVTNKKCPFVSTAFTSECLDRLIIQKEKELKNLIVELRNGAVAQKEFIIKEYDSSAMEWDNFLEYLSMHEKSWENYAKSFCGIKNSQIGGTAMSEESRKCKLFQIEQFIQLLNDQKSWVM